MADYLTSSEHAQGSEKEGSEIVVTDHVYQNTPLSTCTHTDTRPPDNLSSINEVKDSRQLQDLIINDKTMPVSVHPVLLTVTGFTNVCKSDAIESALSLKKSPLHCSFTHHEIVASGMKRQKKIHSTNVKLDDSFKFAIQSGIESNFEKVSLRKEVENNSTFRDNRLRNHVHTLAQYLQQRKSSPTLSSKTDTTNLECSLINGVGLANIWDVSINKSVRPFIEAMGCCLTTNQTWLFIDLDQDISKLYLPTESDEHDSFKLQWRSRVHYLLRMCQMSKHTKPNNGFTKFCRIFAVYNPIRHSDIKSEVEKLCSELENAAEQMGVHKLINFEIKPLCRSVSILNKKDLQKTFKSILRHSEAQDIPMSWFFLRSSISEHKGFFIKRAELESLANECNIIGDDFQQFCSFFTSFGSILDPHKITKHSEYIVIKPQEFLIYLENFFKRTSSYVTFKNTAEKDAVVVKILTDVTLALQDRNPVDPAHTLAYYLPSLVDQHSKNLPVQTKGTPGAMQVVLSMGSPKMSMGIEVIKMLLALKVKSIPTCTTSLSFSLEYSNSMSILVRSRSEDDESIDEATITLIFQGDITEVVIKNSNVKVADSMRQLFLKNLCFAIIEGIENIFNERALYLGEDEIRYHFAICCTKDPYKDYVAFNAYRKRHILPNYELCSDCKDEFVHENKDIIKAWNNAISERKIPEKMKLGGELLVEDVAALASEVAKYPWEAIFMLATKLKVKIYLKKPNEDRMVWLILGMLMEWEGQPERGNDEQSPKKVLAQNMMELSEEWKEKECTPDSIETESDFKKLARKLDLQVISKEHMNAIQAQYEEQEQRVKANIT